MGLYDNYKLSNSTGVQQFAGSIVPDLKLAKDQADARYEQSQEGLINLPEVLNQAPINPQDKPVWNQINNEAQEKLASWTKRPDLENATIDIYRYSKQVGNKLKTLADQKKARDTYISEIDKREDIDPLTKQWAKETADADYGQLQFGPDGRPVNQYQGKIPAKQVSKAEKMQKALQFVTGNSSAEIQGYDSENGMVTYKIGNEIKTISEAEVMNAYKSSKDLDPEWQASDEQEQAVKLYHATKGITDDVVLNQIEANPSNLEIQRTKELMETRGYPPALAFKEAKKESIKRNMDNAEAAYARTKMSTNTSNTRIESYGPERQTEAEERAEARAIASANKGKVADPEFDNWIGKGSDNTIQSWAKTGQALTDKLSKFDEVNNSLTSQIEKSKKIAANTSNPLESRLRAEADIDKYTKALASNQYRKSVIQVGQNQMLEKAAQAEFGKSWKDISNLSTSQLNKSVEAVWGPTIKLQDGTTIKSSDIGQLFLDRKISSGYDSKGRITTLIDGKPVELSATKRDLHGILLSTKTDAHKVRNKASQMSTEGIALTTTQVPIKDEKDIKAMKQVAKSLPLYDASGSELLNLDDKDIDWSKTEVGSYIPETKMVNLQLSDGTNVLADMGNFSFNKKVGSTLAISSDPYTQEMGRAIMSDNFQSYQQAFNQASGMITTVPGPDGNPSSIPISIKGKNYGMIRNNDGSVSIVDLQTQKIARDQNNNPYSSLSMFEVTGILDRLKR